MMRLSQMSRNVDRPTERSPCRDRIALLRFVCLRKRRLAPGGFASVFVVARASGDGGDDGDERLLAATPATSGMVLHKRHLLGDRGGEAPGRASAEIPKSSAHSLLIVGSCWGLAVGSSGGIHGELVAFQRTKHASSMHVRSLRWSSCSCHSRRWPSIRRHRKRNSF